MIKNLNLDKFHVLWSITEEEPAAMHHDNSSPVLLIPNHMLMLCLLGIYYFSCHSGVDIFAPSFLVQPDRLKNALLFHLRRSNKLSSEVVWGKSISSSRRWQQKMIRISYFKFKLFFYVTAPYVPFNSSTSLFDTSR